MRIDAHLHFWRPACGFDNRPVADHEAYRRDFLPEHVAPELDACGIDGVILVQTCPEVQESEWLLDLAAREPRVLGVTAWVDLDREDCDIDAVAARQNVVGIRAQLRRVSDPSFVSRARVVANLGRALRAGLNVTFLAEARHYEYLIPVLARLPPGPVTINHLGLPFPHVPRGSWRDAMRAFALRDDLYMQLSGVPFLYGERWREPQARQLMDDALDSFGAQRLLFASDWPMMLRFATYADWVHAVEEFLADRRLSASEQAAIFAGNALHANPRLNIDGETA
jgi:L-fuconolactonase